MWKPHLCVHDKSYWEGLKSIFKPLKRPWVNMEGGTTAEIIVQDGKCPSCVLYYYNLKEINMKNQEFNDENIKVKLI